MPRFPRLVVPGYPHHVTQRGVRRQTVFFDDQDYRTYLTLAAELLDSACLEIWAYCLMPNHVHAVVVPQKKEALSWFFANLHHRYARQTNIKHEWKGHMWQERFYSVVMDEPHTLAAMRYVERNPVRAGLVRSPHEWPWSSARANLGLADRALVNPRATEALVPDWAEYLSDQEDDFEVGQLRDQTRIGRPSGDTTFIEKIELATGRRVRKKRRGRRVK